MAISFDKALGFHEQSLRLRSQRASVLANNLANADTPGFKAKDIDFKNVLMNSFSQGQSGNQLQSTNNRHFGGLQGGGQYDTLFRTPQQPSIDGNTVEEQIENAEYMKNNLAFQASFTMLNNKFMGLVRAIKGE